MRIILATLCVSLLIAGCATKKDSASVTATKASSKSAPKTAPPVKSPSLTVTNGNTIMTLSDTQYGKVYSINTALHFAVLDYSLNTLPNIGDRLFIYRQGIKVGEVRVSGPQMNNNIVADIVAGELKIGDEVRKN
jgi:hypothetical protein